MPIGIAQNFDMNAPAAFARNLIRPIVDFALPPRCPGCGAITEAPHRFCIGCWSQLAFLGEPCCAICALPFEYDAGAGSICGGCSAERPRFEYLAGPSFAAYLALRKNRQDDFYIRPAGGADLCNVNVPVRPVPAP